MAEYEQELQAYEEAVISHHRVLTLDSKLRVDKLQSLVLDILLRLDKHREVHHRRVET